MSSEDTVGDGIWGVLAAVGSRGVEGLRGGVRDGRVCENGINYLPGEMAYVCMCWMEPH